MLKSIVPGLNDHRRCQRIDQSWCTLTGDPGILIKNRSAGPSIRCIGTIQKEVTKKL